MSKLTPLAVQFNWPEEQLTLSYQLDDGFEIVSNERGYAYAVFPFRGNVREFMKYTRRSRADVIVSYGPQKVWEGKLAIKEHQENKTVLSALGGWASLQRDLMFELYVDRMLERWKPMYFQSNVVNDLYQIDEQNRIYAAPRKGEDFDTSHKFGFRYRIPDDSVNKIVAVSFDYEILGTSTWRMELKNQSGTVEASATGSTPTPTTGTINLSPMSLTTGFDLRLEFFYNSGTATEYTGETGDTYLKVTDIRVAYATGTITSADILEDIMTKAAAAGLDVSADAQRIEAQTDDIYHYVEEDITYADAILKVAALADTNLTAADYIISIFEDGRLVFEKKTTNPVYYEAQVDKYKIRQDSADVINKAYTLGHFRALNWRRVRGDVQSDSESIDRFGVQGAFIDAEVLSLTTRNEMAAALVAAGKDGEPEIEITFSDLFHDGGVVQVNPALIKPGSRIRMRGLPLGLSQSLGTITELEVKEVYIRSTGAELMLVRPDQSLEKQVGRLL